MWLVSFYLAESEASTGALAQKAASTQSSALHRCVCCSASWRENKLVHRRSGVPHLLALVPQKLSCHRSPSARWRMWSQTGSSSGVREKLYSHSLIGRNGPELASHLCPRRTPPRLPLILCVPKSQSRFKDPHWKSNSINQIITQRSAGIPMSWLSANDAGRGCRKGEEGGDGGQGVRVPHTAAGPETCWRGTEKTGYGRKGAVWHRLMYSDHSPMLAFIFSFLCGSTVLSLYPFSYTVSENKVVPHLLFLAPACLLLWIIFCCLCKRSEHEQQTDKRTLFYTVVVFSAFVLRIPSSVLDSCFCSSGA